MQIVKKNGLIWFCGVERHFQQYFNCIMEVRAKWKENAISSFTVKELVICHLLLIFETNYNPGDSVGKFQNKTKQILFSCLM